MHSPSSHTRLSPHHLQKRYLPFTLPITLHLFDWHRFIPSKLLTWFNYNCSKKCLGSTRFKFAIFYTQGHQISERGLKYEYRRTPELLSTSSTMGIIFAAILRTTSHRTSIVTVTQPRAVSTWYHYSRSPCGYTH